MQSSLHVAIRSTGSSHVTPPRKCPPTAKAMGHPSMGHPSRIGGRRAVANAIIAVAAMIMVGCTSPAGRELSSRITAEDARAHVNVLASDKMEGRMTASRGVRRAGEYIAKRFAQAGLKPAGDNGTYFQAFPYEDGQCRNVIGLLAPTDGSGEYVMVGAHYDHIGFGEVGSLADKDEQNLIHNGADDNASGTAVVLELAGAFGAESAQSAGSRRGLIFACWSGEEVGVLGSTHFASHPCVPMDRIVAYLNFDMVGQLRDDTLVVQGVGSSPAWGRRLEKRNIAARFDLRTQEDPYQPTDLMAIYPAGVPVIGFFTGVHEHYNKPSDDADTLNYEGMERIALFAQSMIDSLARDADSPAYVVVPMKNASSRTTGVSTGTIPDYAAGDIAGMAISGVRKDGPADQAGLEKGDIIVEFDGQEITGAEDYQAVLLKAKADVTVEIVVVRNDERLTLEITPVGS